MNLKDKRIAVLMGGASGERDVSMASGTAVADCLNAIGYSVDRVVLEEDALNFDETPDVAFIALHGPYGEDGGVQRELEALGIPYTGSGAAVSELAMDKYKTKQEMTRLSVPTPKAQRLVSGDVCTLEPPLVLKPCCEGSSLGLRFVQSAEELDQHLPELLSRYDSILAEDLVKGRELTVGILGEQALPIVEITPDSGRYDFESKYTQGKTTYTCPADIDPELTSRIQADALKLFTGIGCRGFARADVLLTEQNEYVFLEINTIPGLTATSLLPKAAAAAGIPFEKLILRMLELAF